MSKDDRQMPDQPENPMKAAQSAMRDPLAKRFYKNVTVGPGETGFAVLLDGRPLRTPARQPLEMGSEAAARLVAEEWDAQTEHIEPANMPATRLANTALDGIVTDPQAVLEDILKFAGTDLLFYRAQSPEELVAIQIEHWDPIVDWARDALGANFILAEGVMHVTQPREALAAFGARMRQHEDPVRLGCLHTFTTLMGSALLALAIAEGRLDVEAAWTAAHVDEDWNISQWGEDEEAVRRRDVRWTEMKAAAALFEALKQG